MPRFFSPYKSEGGWKRCVSGCVVQQLRWLPSRGTLEPICLGCFNERQRTLTFMHLHGYKNPESDPLHEWADLEPVGKEQCLI